MERYWKEHERFINEINDLRAKSGGTFAKENKNLAQNFQDINMNSIPSVPSSLAMNLSEAQIEGNINKRMP